MVLSSMAASNPRWLAPEILGGKGYSFSSDVYSFGMIMWEFLTWQVPWHDCGPWQVRVVLPCAISACLACVYPVSRDGSCSGTSLPSVVHLLWGSCICSRLTLTLCICSASNAC